MNRRKWIVGTCGVLAAAAYPTYFEPRYLELTQNALKCGVASSKSICIFHLTDLHASPFVPMPMIEAAISLGLEQKPDLICVTGDFVTSGKGFNKDLYVAQLQRLSAVAPTFAVLGNHDGRFAGGNSTVARMLADSGITLLHNRSQRIHMNGGEVSLVGVGDLWGREIDADTAFEDLDPGLPVILMSHNPDSKDVLSNYPWNVMLSGHTHGGQVIVPFEGACFAPVKDHRYVAGLKAWGDRQIFVNRGVGNLGGVRFDCRPEVSILTLT